MHGELWTFFFLILLSLKVHDLLRSYCIQDWQSEPYHQNQNPFERHYSRIKRYTNNIMNRCGAPAYTWFLCLLYVCYLLNHLSVESLGWISPLQALTGQVPDISALLQFHFYQPVYYRLPQQSFPSESEELLGYWVGVAENCGDALTYNILTADTLKIIPRSLVRPANESLKTNLRIDPTAGEIDQKPILFIKDQMTLLLNQWDSNQCLVLIPRI